MPTYIKKSDVGNPVIFAQQKALADERHEDLTHVDLPLSIKESDARDPAKYRVARDMAQQLGEHLEIVTDNPEPEKSPPDDQQAAIADMLSKKNHLVTDDSIYLPNGYDHDTYKRVRALAEKDNLRLRPIASWDDLPDHVAESLTA